MPLLKRSSLGSTVFAWLAADTVVAVFLGVAPVVAVAAETFQTFVRNWSSEFFYLPYRRHQKHPLVC